MKFHNIAAVTSVAVHRKTIIGTTEKGELLVGNARGGFERYRMGSMFIFSIVAKDDAVYACTDRGLYRVSEIQLYMATLFDGVQSMERP